MLRIARIEQVGIARNEHQFTQQDHNRIARILVAEQPGIKTVAWRGRLNIAHIKLYFIIQPHIASFANLLAAQVVDPPQNFRSSNHRAGRGSSANIENEITQSTTSQHDER